MYKKLDERYTGMSGTIIVDFYRTEQFERKNKVGQFH